MPNVPDNAQQQQEVRSVLRQIATSGDEYGKLGKIEGGLYVFDVPGRPGFVFCRIEKEGETEPGICIPLIALDPYVRVKFVRENGVLIAFSADWLDAVNLFGVQAPALGVPLLPMSNRGGMGDSTPTSGNILIGDGQGWATSPLATAIATYVRYLASGAASTLTLAGGVATTIATTSYFLLAAQSGTADDLDTLTVTGNPRLILLQADAGDTITVKHNIGNITLNGAADFALTGDKTLALFWDGTDLNDIGTGGTAPDASVVPYTPDDAGDWITPPDDVAEALDDLAAGAVAGVAWTSLAIVLLGSSAASIDLTSIPAGYDYLVLKYRLRSDRAASGDGLLIEFNGDTTDANYALYGWTANGVLSDSASRANGRIAAGSNDANEMGYGELWVEWYARTDFWKNGRHFGGLGDGDYLWFANNTWKNTAAINQITLKPQVGSNLVTGSLVELIGVLVP